MKELSIEEKAKAYDELKVKARQIYNKENDVLIIHTIEDLFPELMESEDEKVRKEMLMFFKNYSENGTWKAIPDVDEWIAWLEKQGDQKPADKVEPKFKVGDWIVDKNGVVKQILSYKNGIYKHTCGYSSYVFEDEWRLWDITKDAKDGDVLACNEEILLFKSYSEGRISLYCWYNGKTNNFHSKEVVDALMTTINKICPATKEQREALFGKMYDAGYEWDAENKQLKKMEVNPAWTDRDESFLKSALSIISYSLSDGKEDDIETDLTEWLKGIKERIRSSTDEAKDVAFFSERFI